MAALLRCWFVTQHLDKLSQSCKVHDTKRISLPVKRRFLRTVPAGLPAWPCLPPSSPTAASSLASLQRSC